MLFSTNAFIIIVVVCLLAIGCTGWLQQARTSDWLERNGKRVVATITSIEKRPGPCYVITATWKDPRTGASCTFESDPDPRPPEQNVEGAPIDVLLDPANPWRYHLEVERRKSGATRSESTSRSQVY
jgi:hypothetical protein